MKRALDEFIIEGIKTTIPFHKKVFAHQDFINGEFNTGFVEKIFRSDPVEDQGK
jgi:acetyl-CoA carboxylase biotin carboxylase subunit